MAPSVADRSRSWALFAACVALCAAGDAAADTVSSFRVTRARIQDDALQLEVTWQHFGDPTAVEFYGHSTRPKHDTKAVIRAGLELKRFKMKGGAGQEVLSVPLKTVGEKLSLAPGQTICVAALWPDVGEAEYGHRWGTDYRPGQTSIKIPDGPDRGEWQAQQNAGLRAARRGSRFCFDARVGGSSISAGTRGLGRTFRVQPWRGALPFDVKR